MVISMHGWQTPNRLPADTTCPSTQRVHIEIETAMTQAQSPMHAKATA